MKILFRLFPVFPVAIVFMFAWVIGLSSPLHVVAQEDVQDDERDTIIEIQPLTANAGEDKNVVAGRKVIFDASKTVAPNTDDLRYEWDFGDGNIARDIEVVHQYDAPGEYTVMLTVRDTDGTESTDQLLVSVFEDLILLITDKTTTPSQITQLQRLASRQGVLLFTISDRSGNPDFIIEGQLSQELISSPDLIQKSDIIITWTSGTTGLNILSQLAQSSANLQHLDISNKGVVFMSDTNLNVVARTAQSTFNLLQPEYILMTRPEAINSIIESPVSNTLISHIRQTDIEFSVIGVHSQRALSDLTPFNFLSYSINYMVNKGVSLNMITLILIFPIIATLIVFIRQVVGIKSFGIYTPAIITLAFLALGLKVGLMIFIVIVLTGTLIRHFLRRFRFFYFPKMGLVLTGVSFALLGILGVAAYLEKTSIIAVSSFFPMLLMIIMVEKFISVQIEKGYFTAITLSIETLMLSVFGYYVLSWDYLRTLVVNYPEIIILTIIINVVIGRWTGLRLFEYFRFRELLRYIEEK
jgi:hypothetical protein